MASPSVSPQALKPAGPAQRRRSFGVYVNKPTPGAPAIFAIWEKFPIAVADGRKFRTSRHNQRDSFIAHGSSRSGLAGKGDEFGVSGAGEAPPRSGGTLPPGCWGDGSGCEIPPSAGGFDTPTPPCT
jgi:hypothetical protein